MRRHLPAEPFQASLLLALVCRGAELETLRRPQNGVVAVEHPDTPATESGSAQGEARRL
jgi:hypothetical protein